MNQLVRFLFGHEQAVFTNGRFGFDVRPSAVVLVLLILLAGVFVYFIYLRPRARLEYVIECDDAWRTRSTRVSGAVGAKAIGIELSVTPDHQWLYNGVAQPGVSGCIDVDLNFSPSTNLLPIRRLNLEVGQEAPVSAAWLRFPSFKLERFDQVYSRLDETTYRYASNGGKFVAELQVNAFGLVTNYPELWEQELGQPQGST